MQHRHEWDATPTIGSSARIMRGFSRIGIGAAVLTAVLGVAVTASVAFNDYRSATQWPGFPVAKTDPPPGFVIDTLDAPRLKKPANPFDQFDPKPAAKPFDPDEYLAQKSPPSKPGIDDLIPAPAIKPIGKPTFDPGEYEAYKRRAAAEAAKPTGPTLISVDYDPFAPSVRAAMITVLIGLGITAAASLAVLGFFSGLGWVIAGFARD